MSVTQSAAKRRCWSCAADTSTENEFCGVCGALQPAGTADHFHRLALEPAFKIDADALDRHYTDAQRLLHPDRFVRRAPRERRFAMEHATAVNEAYEALKSPLRRAEYLLELAGRPVRAEGQHTVDDTELLMHALKMREALAEAEDGAARDVVIAEADRERKEWISELDDAFAADDLDAAARLALRLAYAEKLLMEAREARPRDWER